MDDYFVAALRSAVELAPEPLSHVSPAEAAALIEADGLHIDSLASALRVAPSTVAAWLSGATPPSPAWTRLVFVLKQRARLTAAPSREKAHP